MARPRLLGAIGAGGLALWLALPGFVNYDTAWSLVWGRELAGGRLPHYEAAFAPTPHPLATLLGVALAPFGASAGALAVALGCLSLAALAAVAFALAGHWFGRAAGTLAALILLTSAPLLASAARAYLDVPYVALVLGALLVEARRARAGAPVLALLALAGMLRPEAWLFSGLYALYAGRGAGGRSRLVLAALALAAPAVWIGSDLAIAGHALHSFTWTRASAAELGRPRGLGALGQTLPVKLESLAGGAVLLAGGLGALAAWRLRPAARGAVCALATAAAACAGLTLAGMPIVTRYLLLVLALLAVLGAGGALGWRTLPRREPARRRWALAGAAALATLALSAPGRLADVLTQRQRLDVQAALRSDLRRLAAVAVLPPGCGPVAVSSHKLVPLLALWLGRTPSAFIAGPNVGRHAVALVVGPATARARRTFLLASSDPPEIAPAPPAGSRLLGLGRAWRVDGTCRSPRTERADSLG